MADLVRTQALLQVRSEQLQGILSSRWYRLTRLAWWARRPWRRRPKGPPRMAGEGSFSRPINRGAMLAAAQAEREAEATPFACLEAAPKPAPGPPRLLLAGHSLHFAAPLGRLATAAGAVVREDRWRSHGDHDPAASAAALAWADVVHCEWCLGNAAWYSRNKRPGQRLVVRFHRMELETDHPTAVDLEAVDAMAFVADHVRVRACERFGWDPADPRFTVVPNGIDSDGLRLAKLPDADFTLGVIGYVPRLKRLDRALDVLEALRREDGRWRLAVKGREPWEHSFVAARGEEREFYAELSRRLDSPALREAVRFDPFGEDVGEFLRGVGWILSTSEVEGHSVALAEGMASGAVPVILDRPGAVEQYGERWVHTDPVAAAAAIAARAGDERAHEGAEAQSYAERWSWSRLRPIWEGLMSAERA